MPVLVRICSLVYLYVPENDAKVLSSRKPCQKQGSISREQKNTRNSECCCPTKMTAARMSGLTMDSMRFFFFFGICRPVFDCSSTSYHSLM